VPVLSTINVIGNLALRNVPLEYPDITLLPAEMPLDNTVSFGTTRDFDYIAATWALQGIVSAPWTTAYYSFCPLPMPQPQLDLYPGPGVNWTTTTVGLHASANCTALAVPPQLFERFEVPASTNSSDGAVYGYELYDWTQGGENTSNSITFGNSLFRMPATVVGAPAMDLFELIGETAVLMSKISSPAQ